MPKLSLAVVLALSIGAVPCAAATAQNDRRQRTSPGLILETGARMGACDALTFTPSGHYLMATGDDKVVRVWRCNGHGVDPHPVQTLRWSIWREQRGAIYALALSGDPDARSVAIGGYGIRTGSVVVLDRATGAVQHALTDKTGNFAVWALAFSPGGDRVAIGKGDGSVLLWNLKSGKANDVQVLGMHQAAGPNRMDRVRFVAFTSSNQVLSVALDGRVLQWNLGKSNGMPTELLHFKSPGVFRAALSPDHKWLAAIGEKSVVEVRSLDGKQSHTLTLPAGTFPQCLAFGPRSERLAVGTRTVPQDAGFFKITDGHVQIYDLRQSPPQASAGPKSSYYPEALAFHPDGEQLAVAGGNEHEVTLWKLPKTKGSPLKVNEIRGPGLGLWGVALSHDGRYLGLRDQRNDNPAHPNQLAKGPWRTFDLHQRKWAAARNFQPVAPLDSYGGWSVQFSQRGVKDAYTWYVVGPKGEKHPLPWDADRDEMPRCYTFLKPANGKPVRLAVGHYWGASIFELDAQGPPRRVRLLTGHQGYVTSIAPSADQKSLVTASRDQTIAAWSLADWPSQPELGARFAIQQGKLVVQSVDAGSPAWELGLLEGDEVVLFAFAGKQMEGGPQQWLKRLQQPVPGKEFFFRVKRGKSKEPIDLSPTTIRQRPLWRFFATHDRDWVLWRWRDYYYDTSVHGDSFIGWHLNTGDVDHKPRFYEAEKFRRRFHRPDKVAEVVRKLQVAPEKVVFPDIEPPRVKLQATVTEVKDADLTVTLTATARGNEPDQKLEQVSLWINSFRSDVWPATGNTFQKKYVIPREKLRRGRNVLTLQGYNKAGGRNEDTIVITYGTAGNGGASLYGLVVGINDYRLSKPQQNDLKGCTNDATAMKKLWDGQQKLYKKIDVQSLLNAKATPEAILGHIRKLAKTVKPDDCLVLFLAGHGHADPNKPESFFFACGTFDPKRLRETTVSSKELYDVLASVNCRKLVMLDSCHSGDAANPIRDLARENVAPIILAACKAGEESGEGGGHGYFTKAVLEAVQENFSKADTDRNGKLDTVELFGYVEGRVPAIAGDQQHPDCFPRKSKMPRLPVAQK